MTMLNFCTNYSYWHLMMSTSKHGNVSVHNNHINRAKVAGFLCNIQINSLSNRFFPSISDFVMVKLLKLYDECIMVYYCSHHQFYFVASFTFIIVKLSGKIYSTLHEIDTFAIVLVDNNFLRRYEILKHVCCYVNLCIKTFFLWIHMSNVNYLPRNPLKLVLAQEWRAIEFLSRSL